MLPCISLKNVQTEVTPLEYIVHISQGYSGQGHNCAYSCANGLGNLGEEHLPRQLTT
jgi:hypothetical protein